MKGTLLNSTTYNGKTYTINDLTGIVGHDFDSSWYGGRIKKFGKTNEGIFLCLELNAGEYRVADLFVPGE